MYVCNSVTDCFDSELVVVAECQLCIWVYTYIQYDIHTCMYVYVYIYICIYIYVNVYNSVTDFLDPQFVVAAECLFCTWICEYVWTWYTYIHNIRMYIYIYIYMYTTG